MLKTMLMFMLSIRGASGDVDVETVLKGLGKAWNLWNNAAKAETEPAWPSIRIQISQPALGVKNTPHGMHPFKYLNSLPELKRHVVTNAEISYLLHDGTTSFITSPNDWLSFFQFLEKRFPDGTTPTLDLKFSDPDSKQGSIWSRVYQGASVVSEKIRTFGKSLLLQQAVEAKDFEKELTYLEQQGFSRFEGKGVVFEELGYSKDDWPDLIDTMIEAGVPQVWGKTLKLAAKAKRGSIKSLFTFKFAHGQRVMNYMKYQIFPDGEGGIDGFFAIYQLEAATEKQDTGIKIEQSFKRYAEMDANTQWKKEVRQFLPGTDDGASGDL